METIKNGRSYANDISHYWQALGAKLGNYQIEYKKLMRQFETYRKTIGNRTLSNQFDREHLLVKSSFLTIYDNRFDTDFHKLLTANTDETIYAQDVVKLGEYLVANKDIFRSEHGKVSNFYYGLKTIKDISEDEAKNGGLTEKDQAFVVAIPELQKTIKKLIEMREEAEKVYNGLANVVSRGIKKYSS